MTAEITDCTIRDGGYLLNKNSDPGFIRNVLSGLSKAGIDFVETGFLQSKINGETLVYKNSKDASKYLPRDKGNTQFLGFCDNSRYSINDLDDYDGSSFKWLRISFGKHEIEDSLKFCEAAQKKGYIVQFNPMDAIGYTEKEWTDLVKRVNVIKPGSLSIVDTFGAMHLSDLINIFERTDAILDRTIKIGLHSHDNLGLSNALAETMIALADKSDRDVIVDGSLFGMGRGAGNASTELLADLLNRKYGMNYNIPLLLETIDKYIMPLREKIHWGYDLPMFICGTKRAHVDNVYHLRKKENCTISDMYGIISSMSPSDRTRYGNNYSKSDFSALDQAFDDYKKSKEA
jgi:isopropylmalate/homocitrate/citramalate synthase